MTIFFPDVSSYTPNVDPAKYPILIARATLSDRVADSTYGTFKAKSAAAGTLFLAYHWLNHGNLPAQAKWCFQHVGPGTPLMIDAEDKAGNTGYNGPLTVADLTGFASAYRALGGICTLSYLPFWYWSGAMSMADLRPLTAAGLHLVSSNYPSAGYTENGPGWAAYGGVTPVQWQYTSTPVDMNAYRGTVAEYAQLVGAEMSDFGPDDSNAWHQATRLDALRQGLDKSALGEDMTGFYRRIAKEVVAQLPATPAVDPAAVAASLTPEQLAAALTAAGITPESVADALATHFHVS